MYRSILSPKRGPISFNTSRPSNSDHISATASSPTQVTTLPTYGGRRWRVPCPRTPPRATKLFPPPGGPPFLNHPAPRPHHHRPNERALHAPPPPAPLV